MGRTGPWHRCRSSAAAQQGDLPDVLNDRIPGALPPWFVMLQIAGALALAPTAFIVNRPKLRAAFPKAR
jgi:hypothetical protein